ncbi:MAG: MBL fold metallo-hydrolase [Bryobacterales bacterium]|nr:MBL fold metallo-hydrolase [Acidobacteriota bacterium]MCB9385236.1 MBL fold metallo-hydrolase [Bryobacterales bacterium]
MKRFLATLLLLAAPTFAADGTLDIYWIDVEGGAATLIVTPKGETVLMDAGWPGFDGRDPKRIVNVLEHVAGKDRINYFITSHFHTDHIGGLPGLAKMVTIEHFVDHGDSVEKDTEGGKKLWDAYVATADGRRMQIKPGDKLPLQGLNFEFVAARSKFLAKPLKGGKKNPLCAGATKKALDEGENGKSVGFIVRQGKFEFLDLGDLSWNYELELACPANLLGEIDLYQVTHHGMDMSGAPAHINAIKPMVAVMNNGHRKGGRPETYKTLTESPSLVDLWQVHKALVPEGAPNTDEKMIANLEATDEGDKGNWIRASVKPNGEFTVTNSRNNYSKTYKPR